MEIKTVTIVGANGAMGSGIGGIFASFGGATVYMVSRNIEDSKKAIIRAAKSVRADSIADKMIPADYSTLSRCLGDSDIVFESVSENIELKSSVNRKIADNIDGRTIVCSGTSGLSITNLSEAFPESKRANYLGVHFFNPPYNMTLCEVIPTAYTDKSLLSDMKAYLSGVLMRTVVESKDCPGFIGNRIGFHFINKALIFSEKYSQKGGIDYIDAILGSFTGRSMAPLATSDFVGLDVHKAIADNIHANTADYARKTFLFPEYAAELINKGFLGRKAGSGLYKMNTLDDGTKRLAVYDISSKRYRDKASYYLPFAGRMIEAFEYGDYNKAFDILVGDSSEEACICLEFMLEYIIYSLFISMNVSDSIYSADDVMAAGFNWCPPLALVDALSAVTNFETLVRERLSVPEGAGVERIIENIKPSRYDYRPYFKAKA